MSKTGKLLWLERMLLALLVVGVVFAGWKYWSEQNAAPVVEAKPPPAFKPIELPATPFPEKDMEAFQRLKGLHVAGNFAGALALAESLLTQADISESFRGWLNQQLAPLMAAVGWMKIHTQDCDEALKIFYRAVRLDPIPEVKKGLGVCLHAAKSWPEAASWLGGYVLEAPADMDARLLYADTLESLGRYDEAVSILEGALAQEGLSEERREVLSQSLLAMRGKAKEGSKQKSEYSRRFFVSFREDAHESIIPKLLDILESATDEFSEILGIVPPEAPIEVVLYRPAEFQEVMPGGPDWAEGVFDGRIRVPLSDAMLRDPSGLLTTILRHELSHALLASKANGRSIPTWFDEGVAQFLSCRSRACAAQKFPATPGQFTEEKIFSEPFITLSATDAGRAYAHSLYLIRLAVKKNGEDSLRRWGTDISAQGTISSDSLANLLGYESFSNLISDGSAAYKGRSDLR